MIDVSTQHITERDQVQAVIVWMLRGLVETSPTGDGNRQRDELLALAQEHLDGVRTIDTAHLDAIGGTLREIMNAKVIRECAELHKALGQPVEALIYRDPLASEDLELVQVTTKVQAEPGPEPGAEPAAEAGDGQTT